MEDANSVGESLDHLKNVRGKQDGAAFIGIIAQEILHLTRRFDVQPGQRLI